MKLSSLPAAVLAILASAVLALPAVAADRVAKVPVFAEGAVLGDPKAPVTIQAYLSFGCSHCIDWYGQTFPELKRRYLDTGKARLVVVEMRAGHTHLAEAGAIAARCAPRDKYFAVADALFHTRPRLLKGRGDKDDYDQPLLDTDGYAREALARAGLDPAVWTACDKAAQLAAFERRVGAAMKQYPGYEGGTPVFLFNGEEGEAGNIDWVDYSVSRASKAAGKPLTTADTYDLFCAGGLTPAGGGEAEGFEQRWSRKGALWRLTRAGPEDRGGPAVMEGEAQVLSDGTRTYLLDGKSDLTLKGGEGETLDASCARVTPTPFPG